LKDASATALCLSEKVLALGTSAGNIHVLDYSGNEVGYCQVTSCSYCSCIKKTGMTDVFLCTTMVTLAADCGSSSSESSVPPAACVLHVLKSAYSPCACTSSSNLAGKQAEAPEPCMQRCTCMQRCRDLVHCAAACLCILAH
jgi:hypothetical protein